MSSTCALVFYLLFNKIYGKTEIHFDKSIHIRYQAFPWDIVDDKVDKNRMVEWEESLGGKGGGRCCCRLALVARRLSPSRSYLAAVFSSSPPPCLV